MTIKSDTKDLKTNGHKTKDDQWMLMIMTYAWLWAAIAGSKLIHPQLSDSWSSKWLWKQSVSSKLIHPQVVQNYDNKLAFLVTKMTVQNPYDSCCKKGRVCKISRQNSLIFKTDKIFFNTGKYQIPADSNLMQNPISRSCRKIPQLQVKSFVVFNEMGVASLQWPPLGRNQSMTKCWSRCWSRCYANFQRLSVTSRSNVRTVASNGPMWRWKFLRLAVTSVAKRCGLLQPPGVAKVALASHGLLWASNGSLASNGSFGKVAIWAWQYRHG